MYIKNRVFKDEDTLLETLFDLGLGTPTPVITKIVEDINKELETNIEYKKYMDSLADEDDRTELQEEETRLRLAEKLLEHFDSFEVNRSKLYGISSGKQTLLYEIDLF